MVAARCSASPSMKDAGLLFRCARALGWDAPSFRSGSTVDCNSSPSTVFKCAKPSKPAAREKRLMAATEVPVSAAISSALCDSVRIGCEDIHRPTRDSEGEASSTADSIRLWALCTALNESIHRTLYESCHS